MRKTTNNSKRQTDPRKIGLKNLSIIEWLGIDCGMTLGLVLLLMFLLSSGLSVVLTTHQNRSAFNELQELKDEANELETEWGQLLIEQSTFGVEGRIEEKAASQLLMQLPDLSEIVMVTNE
jgi:cell division protein FtsL